jgi:hypothetical protein
MLVLAHYSGSIALAAMPANWNGGTPHWVIETGGN